MYRLFLNSHIVVDNGPQRPPMLNRSTKPPSLPQVDARHHEQPCYQSAVDNAYSAESMHQPSVSLPHTASSPASLSVTSPYSEALAAPARIFVGTWNVGNTRPTEAELKGVYAYVNNISLPI